MGRQLLEAPRGLSRVVENDKKVRTLIPKEVSEERKVCFKLEPLGKLHSLAGISSCYSPRKSLLRDLTRFKENQMINSMSFAKN